VRTDGFKLRSQVDALSFLYYNQMMNLAEVKRPADDTDGVSIRRKMSKPPTAVIVSQRPEGLGTVRCSIYRITVRMNAPL
jgi:hypothetical protein